MPFICMPTVLKPTIIIKAQVTDMFPHKTQSSAVLTPNFQGPRYFTAPYIGNVTTTPVLGAGALIGDTSGLSAYLLTTIEVVSAGARALTALEADSISASIIARMESALSLTADDINALIQAETGDNADADGIGKGNSTATVTEILQILSGTHTYTAPDALLIEVLNVFQPLLAVDQASNFTASATNTPISSSYDSFFISARSGQISVAQAKTDSAGNATPLLVAYNNDGSLI